MTTVTINFGDQRIDILNDEALLAKACDEHASALTGALKQGSEREALKALLATLAFTTIRMNAIIRVACSRADISPDAACAFTSHLNMLAAALALPQTSPQQIAELFGYDEPTGPDEPKIETLDGDPVPPAPQLVLPETDHREV